MQLVGERSRDEFGPVLITGGAGFLGRFLAARLDAKGCRVTVLDDLSSPNSTFDCPPLASARIRKVHGSVFDRALVERLVSAHPVIVHFASVVGVEETVSRTVPTIENLNGTINVLRSLTRGHVVLFGSSADVYGAHSRLYDRAMREDDPPTSTAHTRGSMTARCAKTIYSSTRATASTAGSIRT